MLKARVYQGTLLRNIDIVDDDEDETESYEDY